MKNRIWVFLFLLLILTSLAGCTDRNKEIQGTVSEDKEITIIMSKHNTMNLDNTYEYRLTMAKEIEAYTKCIELARTDFVNKTGTIVKYSHPISNTQEEYLQNRNTQLYLGDGPELILISAGEDYQNLIKEGVALEIEGKIPNYDNVLHSLKDGYFVPISMAVDTVVLNKRAFRESNVRKPEIDWSQSEFYNIMLDYYRNLGVRLRQDIIQIIINSQLDNKDLFINNKDKTQLANEKMVKAIENIRVEIFESKRYRLVPNYKYEDYYNMIYTPFEDWMKNLTEGKMEFGVLDEDFEKTRTEIFTENPIIFLWGSTNCLNALETNKNKSSYISDYSKPSESNSIKPLDIETDIGFLPRPNLTYSSWGFIVNKNGKNIDEALEFLNILLSDETQLKIYEKIDDKHNMNKNLSFSTPVVMTIEDEIDKIEKEEKVSKSLIDLRKEVIRQISNGERIRNYRGTSYRGAYDIGTKVTLTEEQERIFKEGLEKTIVKIVFADGKYTSEEIMKELRELDNRLNLIFSE